MSCSRYRQLISRYVDDEVTPRQRADLLAHVQSCHECAAWLARARQTDVLLKGFTEPGPSDRVRSTILSELRKKAGRQTTTNEKFSPSAVSGPGVRTSSPSILRPLLAGFLLRFDPSPWRIGLGFVASLLALVGLAYYLQLLPPIWGYDKLGFEYQQDSQSMVGTTPIPYSAVSSGRGGVGGSLAVPNLVSNLPADNSQGVGLDSPVRIRFDQPMDRGSVEDAFKIDPPAAGTFSWDADNEVRFTPDSPGLLRDVSYSVTLSNSAASLAGTPLKAPLAWSFHTQPAHAVTSNLADGATIASTSTFTINFDAPMRPVDATQIVSLHQSADPRKAEGGPSLSFAATWSAGDTSLVVRPQHPLLDGYYYLLVQPDALTAAGDTIGKTYEFDYHLQSSTPRVHLLGEGRVVLATQGITTSIPYALENSAPSLVSGLVADVYSMPAEWLSALGAAGALSQDASPALPLPGGVLDVSRMVRQIQPILSGGGGSFGISHLSAGIYLVVAGAGSPQPIAGDWKLLVVSDGGLNLTAPIGPFWATNVSGRAWTTAEISLYSPAGALLEKGLTNNAGVWTPSHKSNGATLAIARDGTGSLAAAFVDPATPWGQTHNNSLAATLITDLPAYNPGDSANFHLQLAAQGRDSGQPPFTDQDVTVQLLTPGGAPVQTLDLKPDDTGGISGVFPLSSDAKPGTYTIRVRSGAATHDFPLDISPKPSDTLSVAILPSTDAQSDETEITRTVSVLGPAGQPEAGVLVTATLGIRGDGWKSDPVTATTDGDGLATVVVSMPSWFALYNDPGIFLNVSAQVGALSGSDKSYLDFTPTQFALSGTTQLVAPGLNAAVIARPAADGGYMVRVVLLNQQSPHGDILLQAVSPDGAIFNYALDMAHLLDATVDVPHDYAGGTLNIRAAGKSTVRTLPLMPVQSSTSNLQVTLPFSVNAGATFPVSLALTTTTSGPQAGGMVSLWVRRVSGEASADSPLWQPALALDMSGTLTTSVQAPTTPGLWYLMGQAATPSGEQTVSWGVLNVLPGPWVQLPPPIGGKAGDQQPFSLLLYNLTSGPLSTSLTAYGSGSAQVVGDTSQVVELPAGGRGWLSWIVQPTGAGDGHVAFSFAQDSGVSGSWTLDIPAESNPNLDATYTSGVLTDQRSVGVSVPWGLSGDSVHLEIRASTSLLPTLSAIAIDLQSSPPAPGESVSSVATLLSAPFSVASAYTRLNSSVPDDLQLSGVQYSLLLQQLYSAQHSDGSWGKALDGSGDGSLPQTAQVLLAFYRSQAYKATGDALPAPDPTVINRALDYISNELARPVAPNAGTDSLDTQAYGLYVLSLYRAAPVEMVRAMLSYTAQSLSSHQLSEDGQAWLTLALWQEGNSADATALLDHILTVHANTPSIPSAAMLEALVVAQQSLPANAYRSSSAPNYAEASHQYLRALMEARQGAGWQTPEITADALWALSRFAATDAQNPQSGDDSAPSLTLGDRAVQAGVAPGLPGTVSVVLSGSELRSGTNWLTLKPSDNGQPLYYSLALVAEK